MTTYVALLRGINVGGKNKVAMADLREFLARLGLADAKTLLQSGNVVFRSEGKTAGALENFLEKETAALGSGGRPRGPQFGRMGQRRQRQSFSR